MDAEDIIHFFLSNPYTISAIVKIYTSGHLLKRLLGDLTLSIHGLCAKFYGFHIPDMLPTLPLGRPPAVVQSLLFKIGGSAFLGMWHVLTFSRNTIGLRRSDRPVIGLEETLRTPTFYLAEGINSDVKSVNIVIHSA